nr:hypothetical protein OH826_20045 [Streptomyces sp. NBC_00899]
MLLAFLVTVVTLLTGGCVLALLVRRPGLATPVTASLAAMMFMVTVIGVLVAVTHG